MIPYLGFSVSPPVSKPYKFSDLLVPQVSALESESDGLRIARQEASRDLLLARNQEWLSNLSFSLSGHSTVIEIVLCVCLSNLTEKSLLRLVLCMIEVISLVDVGRPIRAKKV